VVDVVNALIDLVESPEAVGQIFNIGSDDEITIIELAELVKEVTGSDSPIQRIPYAEAYGEGFEDMQRRVPDLKRVREMIGYRPTRRIREIVAAVAEHMARKQYQVAHAASI
jgi:UDP-glucose 4-epimerase